MSKFQTVAVPFTKVGNRCCLTGIQLMNEPWLQDFIDQFPHCFRIDPYMDILWFEVPEENGK